MAEACINTVVFYDKYNDLRKTIKIQTARLSYEIGGQFGFILIFFIYLFDKSTSSACSEYNSDTPAQAAKVVTIQLCFFVPFWFICLRLFFCLLCLV